MSIGSHISLIDLSKQIPFDIDEELKKELCFAETLVISCGHYEGGDEGEEETESDWTCQDSAEDGAEEAKEEQPIEIKDYVGELLPESEEDSDTYEDDFRFYFFPDCSKPPVQQDSRDSVFIIDGMPKLNPKAKEPRVDICKCDKNRKGQCTCFVQLPCYCGDKAKDECLCKDLKNICICQEPPNVKCRCDRVDGVCACIPTLPRADCVCEEIVKPCVCKTIKYPSPVCPCPHKPKFTDTLPKLDELASSMTSDLGEAEDGGYHTPKSFLPCDCQKPDPVKRCTCRRGEECICKKDACVCGVQKTCICVPANPNAELICKSDESKSICSCPNPKDCTCDAKSNDCKCFPQRVCTCGDPSNCRCIVRCTCAVPCICDTQVEVPPECICLNKAKPHADEECTCPCKRGPMKIKKVQAGKEGYRWCHDVDPRHTYFDYGYNMYDKIDYKIQEKEKLKILGLYDEKVEEKECPVHGIKVPPYKKKVRKQSVDCCSAVGGINISVETLGEDADKFLVQVVSNSSKEGASTGTKLISIVDCNLHTLEENRIEYITKRELTKERRSYMAICENGYYNKVTRICGDRSVVKRLYHSFDDAREFLLEGSNIILLRFFGLRRYKGTIKTETVLISGVICESIYHSYGTSPAVVNNKPLYVVKVERHIIEPSGVIHQTLTVVTLKGYVVSHEWADNNYMLHLNPLLRVYPDKDEIEQHTPLREKWREDLQLLSDYLDFKSERTGEGTGYMAENGSLTNTIKDYLQAILLLKPQDVRHFTRHYFNSVISALDLPHDDYFDSCPKHVRYFYFEE